ncbi:head maturation protease, ClpP-related [Listeria booriae]|uniref:head maturation protease, ClpP-related n=1 Tax=Listeria booriae TaxID=1552123 RepID=UPI001629DD54|nr:head maturation protease, ClpP-related [Listeria booriae]MBC1233634.1 Clp protease ClpP [Listeria booriae]
MTKIEVKGPIVSSNDKWIYDWLDMEATCPNDVNEALRNVTGEVEVWINSNGGDVFAGSEIYTALKSYAGQVTVKIVGMAASAASVIAMAGDKVLISPTGQMMIHNVQYGGRGDYRDLQKASDIAKNANVSIANAYQLKTGKTLDELLNLMGNETWLSPQQTVEMGLADEMMFQENVEVPQLIASTGGMLSQATLDKVRGMQNKTESNELVSNVTIPAEQIKEMVDVAITAFKNDIVIDGKTLQQRLDEEEKGLNEPKNIGFKRFFF